MVKFLDVEVRALYTRNCSSKLLVLLSISTSIPLFPRLSLSLSLNIPLSFVISGNTPSVVPTRYKYFVSGFFILSTLLTSTWSILGGTSPNSYSSKPKVINFINFSKEIISSPISSTIWSNMSTTMSQTCEY